MEKKSRHLWTAIIAGGQGTCLFPLSHKACSKQFCQVDDEDTFIQKTVKRFVNFGVDSKRIVIITTNASQTTLAKEQTLPIGILSQNIHQVAPTFGYAGAMIKAAEFISEIDKDAIIINSPADQFIIADEDFIHTLELAVDDAAYGYPNVIGVKINDLVTVTGCGHAIYDPEEEDIDIEPENMTYTVKGFIEKPNRELADKLMREGNSACNTGINVWHVSTILDVAKEITFDKNGLGTDELMSKFSTLKLSVGKFR